MVRVEIPTVAGRSQAVVDVPTVERVVSQVEEMSTAVVFPMTDDAVDVPRMPQRRHRGRRLVLVPQSQDGTPRSIQDRVSSESEGGHSRFASGAGEGNSTVPAHSREADRGFPLSDTVFGQ